jgi:uncharacterized protein YfbU (UPF0304 family)
MARKSRLQMARESLARDEVVEIIAMFRALGRSYDALPDKSGIAESLIRFDGFDAHNEADYLTAAEMIAGGSRDINVYDSHMPRLRGYQMMLEGWRSSHDRDNLTKTDILRILSVFSKPRNP